MGSTIRHLQDEEYETNVYRYNSVDETLSPGIYFNRVSKFKSMVGFGQQEPSLPSRKAVIICTKDGYRDLPEWDTPEPRTYFVTACRLEQDPEDGLIRAHKYRGDGCYVVLSFEEESEELFSTHVVSHGGARELKRPDNQALVALPNEDCYMYYFNSDGRAYVVSMLDGRLKIKKCTLFAGLKERMKRSFPVHYKAGRLNLIRHDMHTMMDMIHDRIRDPHAIRMGYNLLSFVETNKRLKPQGSLEEKFSSFREKTSKVPA